MKETHIPLFIAALITIARKWKQSRCPSIDEWIKKMWYIYTMEYFSTKKKDGIMPCAATWMYLGITRLSEVSQKKDRYHKILLVYRI